MKAWFSKLNVQSKLFVIFGVTTLIGAFTVGLNILHITSLSAVDRVLLRLAERLETTYRAENLVQQLDMAEKRFILSGEISHRNEFRSYSEQIDGYIRLALLEADAEEEKGALSELEHIKEEHDQTFDEIIKAVDAQDWDTLNGLMEEADQELDAMHKQIDDMHDRNMVTLTETDERRALFECIAMLISVITLLFCLASAIVAAVVITKQVNQPIQRLTDAAAAVGERHFEPELVADLAERPDEIGHLAHSLADMAAAVRQREEDLKQQVDQIRTKVEQNEKGKA
jgi:nitrate/nitrite-specific signal transduction histidine kinase